MDLFDLDLGLSLAGFAFLLFTFIKELAKIHDPAYRRFSIWSNFDQVKPGFVCPPQCIFSGYNPDIFALVVDETDALCPDGFVYAKFLFTTNFILLCFVLIFTA